MKVSTDHPVCAAVGPPVPVVEPVPARRGHVSEHASLVPGHVAPEVVLVPRVHAEQRAVVGGRQTLGPGQWCQELAWLMEDEMIIFLFLAHRSLTVLQHVAARLVSKHSILSTY